MTLIADGEREFREQENWFLILVKLDLEARGYIQLEYDSSFKTHYLRITEEGVSITNGVLKGDRKSPNKHFNNLNFQFPILIIPLPTAKGCLVCAEHLPTETQAEIIPDEI